MITTTTQSQKNRSWWLVLIIGILSVLCGLWVFRHPVESYFALSVYFSLIFMMYGLGEIIHAFADRSRQNWGWGLGIGVLNFVIGFLLLINIAWAVSMLPYIVGFILMFIGINFIGQASSMQTYKIPGWGWLLTGGVLTLLFAFLIIFHPIFGVFDIIVWTGLSFVFGGISTIFYAFILKK